MTQGQQRGCSEGQYLYHASVKWCQTRFINLVQEAATHEVSRVMKSHKSNGLLGHGKTSSAAASENNITTIYLMLQELSSSYSVTRERHSSVGSFPFKKEE